MPLKTLFGLIFSSLIATVLPSSDARSEDLSKAETENLIVGFWTGRVADADPPYVFETVNCSNGRSGTRIVQKGQDDFVYLGTWDTDGETLTHHADRVARFETDSGRLLSVTGDEFSNTYHIVILTEDLFVYEWRGRVTRRFFAEHDDLEDNHSAESVSRGWLIHIACYAENQTS